jgi:hypothetical protein
MKMRLDRVVFVLLAIIVCTSCANAQNRPAAQTNQPQQTAPPPATKLEGFKPTAGSVTTLGYDELGGVRGVEVQSREMRNPGGLAVRGLLVDVTESEYRNERSFVDADEIPELLKGIDALLQVKSNPTQFKNFEVRYTTRGELELTAFNRGNGDIVYAVQAGRGLHAQRVGLSASEMQKIRGLFAAAAQELQVTK